VTVYRIDGKLVGISVIDILPYCVSSVYFLWDPDYAWASLGKLSAMREIALARDIRAAGVKDMRWVYMGEQDIADQD
jgi:arginine-tRNA-protein transferase